MMYRCIGVSEQIWIRTKIYILKFILENYWLFTLIVGNILTFYVTFWFLIFLPEWVDSDGIDDDKIPPEPNETLISILITDRISKYQMVQPYALAEVI